MLIRNNLTSSGICGKNDHNDIPFKQRGYILSLESLLFALILVVGLVVGWVNIRDAVNAELMDAANVIEGSITFPYFSDPNRGAADTFTPDKLEFVAPDTDEPSEGSFEILTGSN